MDEIDLILEEYVATANNPKYNGDYEVINSKFPELKAVIVDLLTHEFDSFLASIDWVAPKPTTFRINLKNDQDFYLIYSRTSWIAQIEGKKYYLLNILLILLVMTL